MAKLALKTSLTKTIMNSREPAFHTVASMPL